MDELPEPAGGGFQSNRPHFSEKVRGPYCSEPSLLGLLLTLFEDRTSLSL